MAKRAAKKKPAAKSRSKASSTGPLDLVMEMMAIPGMSGQEQAIMDYIRGRLVAAGADEKDLVHDNAHKKTPLAGQVGNLVLKLPGTVRGPRRMLSAHVDTVPVCVGSKPVKKGKFVSSSDPTTGLGADDRAGAAVLLNTAETLLAGDVDYYPTTLLWTVQEEVGLYGARNVMVSKLGKPELCFNFDGGSPAKLTIGATGGYRMTIEVHGIASHAGGAPEQGVSAIAIASIAIADLVENGWHGLIDKYDGTGTSNVGVFEGGAATNVVTNYVKLRAEARSHDPKFRELIVKEIKKAFDRALKKVTNDKGKRGRIDFNGQLDYDSFRLPEDDASVVAAASAVEAEGGTPVIEISNGGLDANWLAARGLPAVTMGCGQKNIHTVDEQLVIAEYETACRQALRLVAAE
ncbi:M20/M25/M40 family metallo-hydrolase [Aeoliella mucimassa]|uniref:Carboxypeptidase G2 n=1 Tax=Aeoliella mucimassa TaxID=2527972 RepID=A0A518AHG5_9BACT|nr:M20/M25/M40 family metallo-hydrolase [Aeoliella mucimassa]QDU54178.1 Carboxypeptidase G2 precursor [Aeoliella mucimassa]